MAKAYQLVLEISDEMRNAVYERQVMYEKLVVNGMKRGSTGMTTDSVRDLQWTNLTFDWFIGLSNPSLLFVIKNIVPQLKLYNMLWHRPISRKSSENIILKELVDNKILYRTEVPGIYLVNPIRVWRGNPIVCVEETKEMLRIHKKPSIELIKDRRPSDKYTHANASDQFYLLGGEDLKAPNNT